jgi:hypothetical protein
VFVPIDLPRDLPEPGIAYEGVRLDFKAQVDTTSRFEPAKDVAAFANAYGGTILVGAAADGECIKKYLPFSAGDASLVQRCYEESVRDRCRPKPLVSVVAIARDGGLVVAVNVWPTVGLPVGVALKRVDFVKPVEDAFLYPVRVGAHTQAILPEQMHMFVDARFRRTVLALQGSLGARIKLLGRTKTAGWWGRGTVTALDERGNALAMLLDFPAGAKRVSLPLELVEAVWRDSGGWKIRIPGHIDSVQWFPNASPELQEEETVFLEVQPASQGDRAPEQRVRITEFPHQLSFARSTINSIRRYLRRPS